MPKTQTNYKRWSLENGFLEDQEGNIVAIIPDTVKSEDRRILESAPLAIEMIKGFIGRVNKGHFKPRTEVKEFEKFLLQL